MLSQPQFNEMDDTTKMGAMPIDRKFIGPSADKTPSEQNKFAYGADKPIAKPGFF
jgi:hypothetical protein